MWSKLCNDLSAAAIWSTSSGSNLAVERATCARDIDVFLPSALERRNAEAFSMLAWSDLERLLCLRERGDRLKGVDSLFEITRC